MKYEMMKRDDDDVKGGFIKKIGGAWPAFARQGGTCECKGENVIDPSLDDDEEAWLWWWRWRWWFLLVSGVYCREVGTVNNAARSLLNYYNNRPVVGSIARFACNPHHVMQGSPDRVCQADGSWSGQLPRCIRKSWPLHWLVIENETEFNFIFNMSPYS